MRFRRVTENNTLIPGILEALLYLPEVFAFQVKAEARRGERSIVPKGTADILGVHLQLIGKRITRDTLLPAGFGAPNPLVHRIGQAFAIETKWTHRTACKCKSCVAQRTWRELWEKRGGLYILAQSPREAIDGLMGRRAA